MGLILDAMSIKEKSKQSRRQMIFSGTRRSAVMAVEENHLIGQQSILTSVIQESLLLTMYGYAHIIKNMDELSRMFLMKRA